MNHTTLQKMRHTALISVSYAAFLLLIMPANIKGIAMAMGLLVVGAGFFWAKPVNLERCSGKSFWIPLLASVPLLVYLGNYFYNQWLPSSAIGAIAAMLHVPSAVLIAAAAATLVICAWYFAVLVIQAAIRRFTTKEERQLFSRDILCCLIAAGVTVASAQVMIDVDILAMGTIKFIWGLLLVADILWIVYCVSGKMTASIVLGSIPFMIIATVNVYVFKFRGRLFDPMDILSLGTVMNVVDNYAFFPIPVGILVGWGLWGSWVIMISALSATAHTPSAQKRISLACVCLLCSIVVMCYSSDLKTYRFYKDGAIHNGFFLDFVAKTKDIYVSEPKGYSEEYIETLSVKHTQCEEQDETHEEAPHIIAIMDEAFSDLNVFGEISTDTEVLPFISSVEEDAIIGYALASVYGGNTANSEFEFLTGNTMAWLSPNSVPYQQYVKPSQYSMVSYLKSLGDYHCVAVHPYYSNGWNRPQVYEALGFDEAIFIDDFPQENMLRTYVSDWEMFEKIVDIYESSAGNSTQLFLFGITMQNHGDYDYSGDDFEETISLIGYEKDYPRVEQYLSLLRETDKAVEYLTAYFSEVEEDVVIVFFGDHQPLLEDRFYHEIGGSSTDSLDDQQLRYKVPFFIWANYDIEEDYVDCTSLNYLSSYVYRAAGIALPPYNRFLSEMEAVIPSINANGFYSMRQQCYLPFDMASEEEKEWLRAYEMLQYNNLFDRKTRNEALFPVAE